MNMSKGKQARSGIYPRRVQVTRARYDAVLRCTIELLKVVGDIVKDFHH